MKLSKITLNCLLDVLFILGIAVYNAYIFNLYAYHSDIAVLNSVFGNTMFLACLISVKATQILNKP